MLIAYLGSQQVMTQELVSATHVGDPDELPGSWLHAEPTLSPPWLLWAFRESLGK